MLKNWKFHWKQALSTALALTLLGLNACGELPITTVQNSGTTGQNTLEELTLPNQSTPQSKPVSGELQGTVPAESTENAEDDNTPRISNILVWEISKPDSKPSYFIGTVHTRFEEGFQVPAALRSLIENTDLYVMEVNLDNPETLQTLIAQLAFDTQQDLKAELSESEWATLVSRTKSANIPEDLLAKFRPWYLNLSLNANPSGSQPNQIMDQILRQMATAAERNQGFLETPEEQLSALAQSLSFEEALELLKVSLKETPEEIETERNEIFEAYNTSDLAAMERIDEETRQESEKYYTALIENRNIIWAQKIIKRLDLGESLVVAVGALHLVGPRSVLKSMEALGYTTRFMDEISNPIPPGSPSTSSGTEGSGTEGSETTPEEATESEAESEAPAVETAPESNPASTEAP